MDYIVRTIPTKAANPINPLGSFPRSIYLHKFAICDTIRAWVPFGCLPEVLRFLDDAAIVTAVQWHDAPGGINSMLAYVLDYLDESLAHNDSDVHPYQPKPFCLVMSNSHEDQIECWVGFIVLVRGSVPVFLVE